MGPKLENAAFVSQTPFMDTIRKSLKDRCMIRFLSLGIVTAALALPACSSQAPEPEPSPPVVEIMPIPPPPPPFVDVLPEFKKSARAFLDLAKKLDEVITSNPPPPYQ